MYKKLLFLVLVCPVSVFAQNAYDLVYATLNTKCSNAACHSAAASSTLRFDTTSAAVYTAIYNQKPTTTATGAVGTRLVWVDQPYNSYLLKKAASWLDTDLALDSTEADSAHVNCGLTNMEAEYIRQWILNGAFQIGRTVDTATINAYYNDTARASFYPKPARPAAGTGNQVRFGPIFVRGTAGNNEVEYCMKYELDFPGNVEVTSTGGSMDPESHHFLLFRFQDSASAAAMPNGMRQILLTSGNSSFDGNKALVSAWQTNATYNLPTQTAFFWPGQTWLDLNYHMKNYTSPGTSGILPFDFYLNVSTQPHPANSNTIEMKTSLQNNVSIVLWPNAPAQFNYGDNDNQSSGNRYIWMMSSHTHKFGTGYMIYTYDTTKPNNLGDTLYNGNWDYTNGFDRGYYDWEHPSVEYFAPQRKVDMQYSGVIAHTNWINTSSSLIHFGYTTSDEMQLYYYMYTDRLSPADSAAAVAGIQTVKSSSFDFSVYPNPMSDMGTIMYTLADAATVKASIMDITGHEVAVLKEEKDGAGTYNVDMGQKGLAKGIYFARLNVDGTNYTKKFIVD